MTSESMWDRLGIAATSDVAAIKSAYAARAKECHPEEHPEEFIELQKAYKSALKYAKNSGRWEKEQYSQQGQVFEEKGKTIPKKEPEIPQTKIPQTEIPQTEIPPISAPKYDFDEIAMEKLSEKFFHEFCLIAKNPFLINDLTCWDIFLKQEEYLKLFEDISFRRNLVLTMCRYLSGWYRETIRYFDGWLKSFEKEEDYPATGIKSWKRKRERWFDRGVFSFPAWRISKEQRAVHKLLLEQAKKDCGDDNTHNPETMKEYLKCYFSYVDKYPGKMEKMEFMRTQNRSFVVAMVIAAILFVAMQIHLTLWYRDNPDKHHNFKEQRQEWVTPTPYTLFQIPVCKAL